MTATTTHLMVHGAQAGFFGFAYYGSDRNCKCGARGYKAVVPARKPRYGVAHTTFVCSPTCARTWWTESAVLEKVA